MHAFWLVLSYDLLEDRHVDDVIIKTFFFNSLLYKQIDSKLPCICSIIDCRGCQNVVRTPVTHLAAPRVPLFCSYHILTLSVIYYWTDAQQLGIYLLNRHNCYLGITPSQPTQGDHCSGGWVEGISKEQSCYVSAMLQVQFLNCLKT